MRKMKKQFGKFIALFLYGIVFSNSEAHSSFKHSDLKQGFPVKLRISLCFLVPDSIPQTLIEYFVNISLLDFRVSIMSIRCLSHETRMCLRY